MAIMPYPQIHQWYHCDSSHAKRVIIAALPRITPHFRYQQAIRLGSHIGSGVLTFSTEDFQIALSERLLRDGEEQLHPFDAALLQWVKDIDDGPAEPCLLPVGWFGIEGVLLSLIEGCKYSAFCFDCQRRYEPSEIKVIESEWCGGYGYSGIDCPDDHRLFRTEVIHVVI